MHDPMTSFPTDDYSSVEQGTRIYLIGTFLGTFNGVAGDMVELVKPDPSNGTEYHPLENTRKCTILPNDASIVMSVALIRDILLNEMGWQPVDAESLITNAERRFVPWALWWDDLATTEVRPGAPRSLVTP